MSTLVESAVPIAATAETPSVESGRRDVQEPGTSSGGPRRAGHLRVARTPPSSLAAQEIELRSAESALRAQLSTIAARHATLVRARERQVDLFHASPHACAFTTTRGIIEQANSALSRLTGIELRFLRGKPLGALLSAGAMGVHEMLSRLVTNSSPSEELWLRPRAGEAIAVRAHLIRSTDGAVLWTFRAHLSEREMSSPLLFRQLAESDAVLARLRAEQREQELGSALRDRALTALAVELRGHVNAILAWTSALRSDPSQERVLPGIEAIERSARMEAELLVRAADEARLAAGEIVPELARVDLAALVQSAVERHALAEGPALELSLEDELPIVADARLVEQLLRTALSIATRASRGAPVRITARRSSKGTELSLRTVPRTEGAREGEAIDLYVLKRLVELLRGGLSLTDQPGDWVLTIGFD